MRPAIVFHSSRNLPAARLPAVLTLWLLTFLACATPVIGDEEFPFTAWVTRDRTHLKSGPGDEHYVTDELPRGAAVEVYRRVEEGWLAVRPPASSFSWVAERDLRPTAMADVFEIAGTAAVSWIGSNLVDATDHRWLVKLDAGETVHVLGRERRRLTTAGKSEVYCQIAPPAGEFRWVHEDEITRDEKELETMKDPAVALADFKVALRGSPKSESADAASKSTPTVVEEPKRDAFSARDKRATITRDALTPTPPAAASSRERMSKVASIPSRSSPTMPPAELQSVYTPGTPAELESQIRQLEAQLSLAVTEPAESWNFSAIRAAADRLLASSESTLNRARVQLFLDKLSEFEGLKSRHALMAPKPALPTARKWSPASLLGPSKASPAESPATPPRFDGTGLLFPVTSKKKSSPPYALLDQDGNILQFVSPAPGLNLNRYLRKEIGVFGQRDQPSTLDKPHLTAQRVVELDRHRQ